MSRSTTHHHCHSIIRSPKWRQQVLRYVCLFFFFFFLLYWRSSTNRYAYSYHHHVTPPLPSPLPSAMTQWRQRVRVQLHSDQHCLKNNESGPESRHRCVSGLRCFHFIYLFTAQPGTRDRSHDTSQAPCKHFSLFFSYHVLFILLIDYRIMTTTTTGTGRERTDSTETSDNNGYFFVSFFNFTLITFIYHVDTCTTTAAATRDNGRRQEDWVFI